MEIMDYSKEYKTPNSTCGAHAAIFPKNIFCIIAGSTGSGKTNLMINFLRNVQTLNYRDVYVYSPTLHQDSYVNLKDYYQNLEKLIKLRTNLSVKIAHFFDTDQE